MEFCEVYFDARPERFSVRQVRVRAALSEPFVVELLARSEHENENLDQLVGTRGGIRFAPELTAHLAPSALLGGGLYWSGVCTQAELLDVEPGGLSSYGLTLRPELWLLSQRRNYRVFQSSTAPAIVRQLLREWNIDAVEELDLGAYLPLDYRVQYGESDLQFISRLLEDAGISYFFRPVANVSRLILSDRVEHGDLVSPPIPFTQNPSAAQEKRYATALIRGAATRPGVVSIRDYDFLTPQYAPRAEAQGGESESALEQYFYRPGESLRVGIPGGETPYADHHGAVRSDPVAFQLQAQRQLGALRSSRRRIAFNTTALELAPGSIAVIDGHPRSDLDVTTRLVVSSTVLEASANRTISVAVEAAFADQPWHPAVVTPRPLASSLQSATVVGPPNTEIHTDEHGRVQLQFPWDRYGQHDEQSSCWVRVSQGWAGAGFGMFAIPRVGQEVLVGFLDGCPDQPIVVGRLFNRAQRLPYALPGYKTRTGIRTASTPDGEGYNELSFDDDAGRELFYLRAERDMECIVTHDRTTSVGGEDVRSVAGVDRLDVSGEQHTVIDKDRVTTVRGDDRQHVFGARHVRVDGSLEEQVRARVVTIAESDRREVRGDADLLVRRDLVTQVQGNATLLVGTAEEKRSCTTRVEGETQLSSLELIDITSDKEIRLRCGSSFLRIRDGSIELSAGSVTVHGEDARLLLADGEAKLKVKNQFQVVSDDRIVLKAASASVGLARQAKIDGSHILLNSPEQASDSIDVAAPNPTLIRLLDQNGEAVPYQRYVVRMDSGEEISGFVDEKGEASVELPGAGRIVFPDLVSVEEA